MTLEEYEQKLDAALGELDWRDPRSMDSSAYKVLAEASKDKALSLDAWMKLHERYWKAVKKL